MKMKKRQKMIVLKKINYETDLKRKLAKKLLNFSHNYLALLRATGFLRYS
tara:strand:+ start:175 stop:324 length:150 start_codon:yes stop_codon:yes gene_type:complete